MLKVEAPITQRRIGLRFRFELGPDALKYSARDYSGERTIEIPYESINLDQPAYVTMTATPLFKRLFGLVLLYLLFAAALSAFVPAVAIICAGATLPLSIAIIIGRVTGLSNIRFKLFQLQPYPPGAIGPMRMIDDPKGEQILALMQQAKKGKFRKLYGKANLTAEPKHEVARLTWLKDNDILSEEEWRVEVNQVAAAAEEKGLVETSSDSGGHGAIH